LGGSKWGSRKKKGGGDERGKKEHSPHSRHGKSNVTGEGEEAPRPFLGFELMARGDTLENKKEFFFTPKQKKRGILASGKRRYRSREETEDEAETHYSQSRLLRGRS